MDGAKAEEAGRDLVARLSDPTISPWIVAELYVLGDKVVGPLEELVVRASGASTESRGLAARLLSAIGTPSARWALRRSLATCRERAARVGPSSGVGDLVIAEKIISFLATRAGLAVGNPTEMRGGNGTA